MIDHRELEYRITVLRQQGYSHTEAQEKAHKEQNALLAAALEYKRLDDLRRTNPNRRTT
ncbi:hypothetical protein [Chromatium okenii]|jgi:hypothetical protein|uniref:hypothetical protein n=1 Tax=Chromatium okenii TaxID=61644 RepID=UPI0026EBC85C|nr:hypothetical protein [Chromatium okenii]MBV5310792.1 hypothetical protein [Chromatium okenii]